MLLLYRGEVLREQKSYKRNHILVIDSKFGAQPSVTMVDKRTEASGGLQQKYGWFYLIIAMNSLDVIRHCTIQCFTVLFYSTMGLLSAKKYQVTVLLYDYVRYVHYKLRKVLWYK